jgi:hypothetical protein
MNAPVVVGVDGSARGLTAVDVAAHEAMRRHRHRARRLGPGRRGNDAHPPRPRADVAAEATRHDGPEALDRRCARRARGGRDGDGRPAADQAVRARAPAGVTAAVSPSKNRPTTARKRLCSSMYG